jgi:hypothetical protein
VEVQVSDNTGLSEAERQTLWEQFVEVHGESQESYDNSVRTIAAAGVGITASLATALHGLTAKGVAAIALFLASLALNLGSYVTAQFDMKARMDVLRRRETEGIERNRWTTTTTCLNALAGVAVIAGGAVLAWFITSKT